MTSSLRIAASPDREPVMTLEIDVPYYISDGDDGYRRTEEQRLRTQVLAWLAARVADEIPSGMAVINALAAVKSLSTLFYPNLPVPKRVQVEADGPKQFRGGWLHGYAMNGDAHVTMDEETCIRVFHPSKVRIPDPL